MIIPTPPTYYPPHYKASQFPFGQLISFVLFADYSRGYDAASYSLSNRSSYRSSLTQAFVPGVAGARLPGSFRFVIPRGCGVSTHSFRFFRVSIWDP